MYQRLFSRPPRGGRGLKFAETKVNMEGVKSPPSRGAWIEIAFRSSRNPGSAVAPLAGGVD